MKGLNSIIINEATMIEAVQFWLESQYREGKCPKVTAVYNKDPSDSTFEVHLEESPASKPAAP